MELTNFKIDAISDILHNRNLFDLHNNFDFAQLNHDQVGRVVEVIFTKASGEWVPKADPDKLTLLFKNVSHIFRKEHDPDYPPDYVQKDGKTVDMIGFSEDNDENMESVVEIPGEDTPAMLFVFVTERAIKIVADSVALYAAYA